MFIAISEFPEPLLGAWTTPLIDDDEDDDDLWEIETISRNMPTLARELLVVH